MKASRQIIVCAALVGFARASPAPQVLDFDLIEAAPDVASGPSDVGDLGVQTASLFTSVVITGVATAVQTAAVHRRDTTSTFSTPYYPALATGYTTDPALTATTSSGQACPTQPEAGTFCGFINPEDPCAPQPDGYGPVPTPDTASAFLAYPPFHSEAQAAPTTVPSVNDTQYDQVFKDLNSSISASSYLGLHTLETYNISECAGWCDSTDLCTAFNLYIERDPSLNPSNNDSTAPTVWGYYCPNPPSMTSFKCTLWGSSIDASMATNYGQPREEFQIVVTGSDGYDKTNSTTPPDCTAPVVSSSSALPTSTSLSSSSSSAAPTTTSTSALQTTSQVTTTPQTTSLATHTTSAKTSSTKTTSTSKTSAPTSPAWPSHPWGPPQNCGPHAINNPSYHMGSNFFPGPFNPQACSDYAYLQSRANQKSQNGQQVKMFNAYYLHKNGVPCGTYCSLFSASLGTQWATFGGQHSGSDEYSVEQSWTYSYAP